MTTITFIGGPETGNVDHVDWGRFRFDLRVPVECNDPHIIAKANSNRFFQVDGGGVKGADGVPDFNPVVPKVQNEVVPDDPADHVWGGTDYAAEPAASFKVNDPAALIQSNWAEPPKPKAKRGRKPKVKYAPGGPFPPEPEK